MCLLVIGYNGNATSTRTSIVTVINDFACTCAVILLYRLFQSDSSKFLKLCSTFQHLSLWEVAMVTCNDTRPDSSIDGLQVFGEYLNESLSIDQSQCNQQLSYLHGQKEIFLLSLRACLATPPDDELFDTKQRPMLVNYTMNLSKEPSCNKTTSLLRPL